MEFREFFYLQGKFMTKHDIKVCMTGKWYLKSFIHYQEKWYFCA